MNSSEFQAYTAQVERSLHSVNEIADEKGRSAALQLMQSLMDLHGAAFSRIVEILSKSGESGRAELANLAAEPLLCGLLVLYGVHPVCLEDRVTSAVEKLQPELRKFGAKLELKSADSNAIRLSVHNSRTDAHSHTAIRNVIEQAIRESAPEVGEISIEGMLPSGFVPVHSIQPAMNLERGEGT